MGLRNHLYTVDIDETSSVYTRAWVERAGLGDLIKVSVHDSANQKCTNEARDYLGGQPQLVYIDSSHQYDHTRAELMLWWEELPPGGLLVMDDVSGWASDFDRTKKGGSHRAAVEFARTHSPNGVILNQSLYKESNATLVYTDVCGFGLFQKPYPFASPSR
jgi:predicted O-methyltransferase YrrM